jgi:NAD-dependent DNA ligase
MPTTVAAKSYFTVMPCVYSAKLVEQFRKNTYEQKFYVGSYKEREVSNALIWLVPEIASLFNSNEKILTSVKNNDLRQLLADNEKFRFLFDEYYRSKSTSELSGELTLLFYQQCLGLLCFSIDVIQSIDCVPFSVVLCEQKEDVSRNSSLPSYKDWIVGFLITDKNGNNSLVNRSKVMSVIGPYGAGGHRYVDIPGNVFDRMALLPTDPKIQNLFANQFVCFTGASKIRRDALKFLVEIYGGTVGLSLTKKTTLLVEGVNNRKKETIKKAKQKENHVRTIDEQSFIESKLPSLEPMRLDQIYRVSIENKNKNNKKEEEEAVAL